MGLIVGLIYAAPAAWPADDAGKPSAAPDFQEVYDLIRTHLAGVNPADLNRTAVESLVGALTPAVVLVGAEGNQPDGQAAGPLVSSSTLFERDIAYVRIGRIGDGLAEALREAYTKVGVSKLNGLILDLRFAQGSDYSAGGQVADLFLSKERLLVDWGSGTIRSKEKTDALSGPVVVLVNGETAQAAEALAAVFREAGLGLIVGSRTAGQAMIAREFPLKNGQRLRIATASVKVCEEKELTLQGVNPDLQVKVSLEEERAYQADPFRAAGAGTAALAQNGGVPGTNRMRRPRFNEADLVRERREGIAPVSEDGRGEGEPEKPVVRDPALARALDVLKGLAVVRPRS